MGYEPIPSAHWVADNNVPLADLVHHFWAWENCRRNEMNCLVAVRGTRNLAGGGIRNCAHSKGYCRHSVHT